ncbi:hypothetical protein FGO68_gene4874 [Halteria grandinella]|uniref:Ubiquitin-like domain-containing protein n=1 Tax=Halteria grandinella TaxID=5974 RepID=A0A8J8NLN9_HALGN|nr:hypothetical protein FGO68_gene4874 [Halteria grandinella]
MTLQQLKDEIASRQYIKAEHMELFHSQSRIQIPNDLSNLTLSALDVKPDETIILKSSSRMQLFISILDQRALPQQPQEDQPAKRIANVHVRPSDNIKTLKEYIAAQEGIPEDIQRIIFAGKQLENDRMIGCYGIQKESTLHLIVRQ